MGWNAFDKMITLATSAMGLVAALAWNTFIESLIHDYSSKYFPARFGLFSTFIYAVIITVLVVWVTIYLGKLQTVLQKLETEKQPTQQEVIEAAVLSALRRFRDEQK